MLHGGTEPDWGRYWGGWDWQGQPRERDGMDTTVAGTANAGNANGPGDSRSGAAGQARSRRTPGSLTIVLRWPEPESEGVTQLYLGSNLLISLIVTVVLSTFYFVNL